MREWETQRLLVTVRTYPVPAWHGGEVSCTAGFSEAGQWIRLHPVPYRFLAEEQRFAKYQWIEAPLKKSDDVRPESYTPNLSELRIVSPVLGTSNAWSDRRSLVMPHKDESMCRLQHISTRKEGPTLGLVRARDIRRLVIEDTDVDWSDGQIARLNQRNMLLDAPTEQLEKIPYKFSYDFLCEDPACKGHLMGCNDWEMLQAYRSWSGEYGEKWESAFRNRFEYEMSERCDTHFFVGTHSLHPNTWMIVGLWYPPKNAYMDRLLD